MRELERTLSRLSAHASDSPSRLAIVGAGRLGGALSAGLRQVGVEVAGPLPRGVDAADAAAVLLCVPDAEIAPAAALIAPGRLVGHCSGATGLESLAPHEAFSMHPLMTVSSGADHHRLAGAGAAVAGGSPRAVALARELAVALGMRPVAVAEPDRAAYHVAAAFASNFLITIEAAAERLAAGAGLERELLVPLVRAAVDNWARLGSRRALTGPIARGDEATVQRQREAIGERAPDLLPLFDALVHATRALANGASPAPNETARA